MSRPVSDRADGDLVATIRDFGRGLGITQWVSPEELRAYQMPLVSRLLLHARKTTKFYKERLDFDLSSSMSIEKIWCDIPLLSRAEAIENRVKLFSRSTSREREPLIEGKTSGSTGMPLRFKKSASTAVAATALTERMYGWWSVDGAKSLALIAYDRDNSAPPPEGLATRGWHSGYPDSIRYYLGHSADVDAQLQWLNGAAS